MSAKLKTADEACSPFEAERRRREHWAKVHVNGDKGVVFCPPLNWRVR